MTSIQKRVELIFIFFLFLGSLSFSLYRHSSSLSWDFAAYTLNAEYLFYNGTYFETVRPPLVPLLLSCFYPLGTLGHYLYILLVSAAFCYTSISLADLFWKDELYSRFIFYFFSWTGYSLVYSFLAGSELLALVFLELFLFNVIRGKVSGHYFALAFLTRYTVAPLFLLAFFYRDWRKIAANIGLFGCIIFPWFLFNYLYFGNWFTSVIDSYTMNIYNRGYMFAPFELSMLWSIIGYSLPVLIIGVLVSSVDILEVRKFQSLHIGSIVMSILAIISIVQFFGYPSKEIRYLYFLVLPVAFFSCIGMQFIIQRWRLQNVVLVVLSLCFLSNVGWLSYDIYKNRTYDDRFYRAADKIKELELSHCEILSSYWVIMRSLTGTGLPMKRSVDASIDEALSRDKLVLIFKGNNYSTIDDNFDINQLGQYPVLFEDNEFVLLGRRMCKLKTVFDETYTDNHCKILSTMFAKIHLDGAAEWVCKAIN